MATVTSLGFSIFTTYKGTGARKAASELNRVRETAESVGKTVAASMGVATAAVAALAGQSLKAGIESNALQQRTNMALETLLGSAEAAQKQMQMLRDFGSDSPIALPVWIRAQQQMISFGIEASKVVPMLDAIQDAVVAAGGTEEEIKGVVRALSQMASKGKLSAEELNQIGERGVDAAGVVALAFGTTSRDIREQITAGTLSVEEFFEGFTKGAEMAFGGAAEGLRQTFTGTLDRLKGVQRRIGEIFATPLVNPDGGGALVELGNAVADMLNNFEDASRPFAEEMTHAITPAVTEASEAIRDFGDEITTDRILEFVGTLKDAAPVITAFAVGGVAKLASGFVAALPGMGAFAAAINPVVAGVAALAVTSPELRASLFDLLDALQPLVDPATDLAINLAEIATVTVAAVAPAISQVASVVSVLTDNWKITIGVAAAVGAALVAMAVSAGATALGVSRLTLSMYILRSAMAAHPILLIAGAVAGAAAGIHYLDEALSNTAEAQYDWSDAIGSSMSQMINSNRVTEDMRNELESLNSAFQDMQDGPDLSWWDKFKLRGPFSELTSDDVADVAVDPDTVKFEEDMARLDEIMTQAVDSGMEGTKVVANLRRGLAGTGLTLQDVLPHLANFQLALNTAKNAQIELEARTSRATAAIIAQADEMRAQNDPLFALVKAQRDLETAQESVNDAINEYGADSDEAKAASLDAAMALMNYTSAGADAANVLGNDLTPEFLAAADAAGFTDELVGLLTGQVEGATDAFLDFADDYEASVHVTGVQPVLSAAERIQQQLDNIDRTVTISFNYDHFAPTGGVSIPGMSTGGPVIGPGTPTSDSIATYLSNGEFVVTAERVRRIGGFGAIEQLLASAAGGTHTAPVMRSDPSISSRRVYVPVGGSGGNVFNFYGPVANRQQAEDMFVQAWKDAKRKNRIS